MSLVDKTPEETYKDLLKIDRENNGFAEDGTLTPIQDGLGTTSGVSISNRRLSVKSSSNNTTAFEVLNADDASKFSVDTTNNYVKSLGTHVNTQYAYFTLANENTKGFDANTHYPIPFNGADMDDDGEQDNLNFGTDPDPATTFTTADGTGTYASDLVPHLWYVPDNITIDAVYSLEGADNATGDTTRFHLFGYTFTSGSTSCLTAGTLLAHNSDVTNDGCEQAYKSIWTVDSSSVAGGKVILAMFRSDSVNSDYSIQVVCKYHIV